MDNKLSNIKERILYLIELKKDTRENIFSKIGMTYGSFKGAAKNSPLNSTAIENILSIYPDIEAKWLITGQGKMFQSVDNVTNEVNEDQVRYKNGCVMCDEKDKMIEVLNNRIEELKDTISILKETTGYNPKQKYG